MHPRALLSALIAGSVSACVPDGGLPIEPIGLTARPHDATSWRVAGAGGDRVFLHTGVSPIPPAPAPPVFKPDWSFDLSNAKGGKINGAVATVTDPALPGDAGTSGHSCNDRLYVPVNLDGANGPNLYAFDKLYSDAGAMCGNTADARCSPSSNGHCPHLAWASPITLTGALDNDGIALNLAGTQLYVNTNAGRFYVISSAGGAPAASATFNARANVGGDATAQFTNSDPFPDYTTGYVWTALDYGSNTKCRVYRIDPTQNLSTGGVVSVDLKDSASATAGCRTSVVFWNGFAYVGGSDGRVWRVKDNGATLAVDVNGADPTYWPIYVQLKTGAVPVPPPVIAPPMIDVSDGGHDYLLSDAGDSLAAIELATHATARSTAAFDADGSLGKNPNPAGVTLDFANHYVFGAHEGSLSRLTLTLGTPPTIGAPIRVATRGSGDAIDPYSSPVVFQYDASNTYVFVGDGGGYVNRWDAYAKNQGNMNASHKTFNAGAAVKSPILIDYITGDVYFGNDNGRVFQVLQQGDFN